MKLKKTVKKKLITLLIVLVIGLCAFIGYRMYTNNNVTETKVIHKIKKYGYELKDSKTMRYKKMFYELEKILKKSDVNEKKYVKKITEMFIYDFYSLNDKSAKTDVGGTDFVYGEILNNFLENAENTYYKYVESNIYHQRRQQLPTVGKIKIKSVTQEKYKYNDQEDEEAYKVKVSWDYTSGKYKDYQKEATLIFIHDGIKLSLVELE